VVMGWLQGTQGAGPGPFRPDGFFGYASQRTVNVGAGQIAAKWGGARGRHLKDGGFQGLGVSATVCGDFVWCCRI
jgi:hypothetical protein